MAKTNCFTFDAATGILTEEIQLEKHIHLQVGIEEHNHQKKKIRECPKSPPKNFDSALRLRSGQINNGHIADIKEPKAVMIHVFNSHKIKTRKDSAHDVIVLGSRVALVQIHNGHGITVHNSTHKWHIHLPENSLEAEVEMI